MPRLVAPALFVLSFVLLALAGATALWAANKPRDDLTNDNADGDPRLIDILLHASKDRP